MEHLKIKLADIDRIELVGGTARKTAAKIYSELEDKPDYLINAGMYDMNSGLTVCDAIVNGNLLNGGNYTDKGFSFDGNTIYPETTSQALTEKKKHFLGGSPTLLWGRAVHIENKGLGDYFCSKGKALRIALGITDDALIVAFPDTVRSLPQMAQIMLDYGCKYAINLDGGGSTRVMQYKNGNANKLTANKENRANSTWLAIYLKKENGSTVKKKVCIDAGHGGTDPGCVGPAGTKEKDVNLSIVLKVRDALQRNNIDVVMTRDSDIQKGKLTIDERAKIANSSNADYVVSIHSNADGDHEDSTGYGTETWAYSNASKGYQLAKAVQRELIAGNGLRDRGVKTNTKLQLLKKCKAPAILVECAFLNNAAEEKLLISDTFQTLTAEAITKGIVKTFSQTWIAPEEKYNLIVGGKTYNIEQENRNGTIWAPVRQVCEVFGCKVGYDSEKKCIVIESKSE